MKTRIVTFFLVRTSTLDEASQMIKKLAPAQNSTSLNGVLCGQQFTGFGCDDIYAVRKLGRIVGTITQVIREDNTVAETLFCAMINDN